MKLPSLPIVVLDTETTGFIPKVHRVIEFASIEARDGKVMKEYEQLFFHADVPPVVQVLTRIRTPDLAGKPQFADQKEEILKHLPKDALIVGQNIGFDIGMLKGEGIDLSDRPWIDTSMLASLVFPELESYSLGYLSTVLNLNHNPPHRALGDVRATLELLSKCWERLLELPEDLHDLADAIMARGPKGYRMLFEALPEPKAKKEPVWLKQESSQPSDHPTIRPFTISVPTTSPGIVDEPLDPSHLHSVIEAALKDSSTRHWIAVKSLRPILRRLPESLLKNVSILYPPHALIDVDAVLRFSEQKEYTADEATIAIKLAWYEPERRDEFPMHGGEDSVWNGKLSCTAVSKAYLKQFDQLKSVVLLDHRELLEFLQNPEHPGAKAMSATTHVVIDDASMLEDTATKAFGWYCAMDDVRAAAQGNELLTRFADTLQLWVEKIRQFQDIRYLAQSDLHSPESKGLRQLISEVLEKDWSVQILRHLEDLQRILQVENLSHRIAWIEQKPNGSQMLQSVPERIGLLLSEHLFKRFPTTLLIPQGSASMLPEILPAGKSSKTPSTDAPAGRLCISFDTHPNLEEILTAPPAGKTVILLPGKGAIEDLYVKYTEPLEAKDVRIICQGVSGGMGRMTAEFLAAKAPALWLLTPWMFEGVDLPQGTVDRLILKTLPFDHPNHPVLSRRSQFYPSAFTEYSMPRLLHRLFRLLRTYARIKTEDGNARLLDDRVTTKSYGQNVKTYLGQFSAPGTEAIVTVTSAGIPARASDPAVFKTKPLSGSTAKPKSTKKKTSAKDQPTLF